MYDKGDFFINFYWSPVNRKALNTVSKIKVGGDPDIRENGEFSILFLEIINTCCTVYL